MIRRHPKINRTDTLLPYTSHIRSLAPRKTVMPYIIRVNQTTGAVDVQTTLTQKPMRYDEAVTKFFLAQYVRARESWLPAAAEENFRAVTILSEPDQIGRAHV